MKWLFEHACMACCAAACVAASTRSATPNDYKTFPPVQNDGAQAPSSSGSWWPLFAPSCLGRLILSSSTISKANRQLPFPSILDTHWAKIKYCTLCHCVSWFQRGIVRPLIRDHLENQLEKSRDHVNRLGLPILIIGSEFGSNEPDRRHGTSDT